MITPPDNARLYRKAGGYRQVQEYHEATLAGTGVPYQTTYVETRHGPTHVVICGDERGKPLILWHGLNANGATWAKWLPPLAPAYRIYAIDTIGAMGKSAPVRLPKRGPAYGQWAADVLEGLGLQSANMIGASNGGWLIGKLAGVAAGTIRSAVLMSSAGLLSVDLWRTLASVPRLVTTKPAELPLAMLRIVSPPGSPPDPFWLAVFELMISSGFRSELLPSALTEAELRELTAPTYLLLGQYESAFDPYRALRRGVKLLPNLLSAEIVPGVGHSMEHEQPDWVIARVRNFLERYAV